jgi:DNA polymerase-1
LAGRQDCRTKLAYHWKLVLLAKRMADNQHLYLVDGSSYIFRAYHRLPPLTDPEGTPVGAVYGYTTMLWKLADDLDKADGPTHLAVILDAGSKSFLPPTRI